MKSNLTKLGWRSAVLALALSTAVFPARATAQDQGQQDDPPTRVARLGYIEGSVSFQPASETDWVQAVANRPMTTGDKLWADKGSRAELQLGSAVIRLSENTGVSFLNLDDHTVQIQLSSGTINLRVRRLDQDDAFEVDTPDLAFTVSQPGNYRLDASEDGTSTVVSLRDGGGQATGNGQTYTLSAGQRATFSAGTDSLNADVEDLGGPDQFDNWADGRDHRYDDSRSAQYVSRDVVGYEDLDDNGSWRDDRDYGHVWYPNNVGPGWAPYREGHWDWISPWGYTWVDDSAWGYAPFHYGRWVTVGGRWGWIAGPVNVQPVYAPALVVFIGGGGGGFGGDVGWFPLGPREVYVPPYQVSRGYMNQVNVSNTTVNTTTITNVYNNTIINNQTTNITNVNYVNRNVQGAVTVVPQRAFAGAQPVGRAAIAVNPQQIARAPVSARVAVVPTEQSVLGAKASTANHVTAPPAAVMNRQVVAKRTPPPPPVPFAKQQQALAAHPGEPLAKHEIQSLRPAGAAAAHPMVKVAPPGKPATPTTGRPGNPPNAGRPGQPTPPPAETNRPPAAQPPNRPPAARPQNRPPVAQPPNRPPVAQPNQPPPRPQTPPPAAAKPTPPAESNRPPAAQPNRPAPPAETNRPPAAQPQNRPPTAQPPNRPPAAQPSQPPPRPQTPPPAAAKPTPPPPHQQPNLTPEQKKKQEEQQKKQEKPPGA
ncbi:MAG: DUF6600 domain-containing protein [Candidatus Korobacteraceae bacterium]